MSHLDGEGVLPVTSPTVKSFSLAVEASIAAVRDEVAHLHYELVRNNLVVWTAGNVSARVPGADLLVIKPSGVSYDDLTPESMVVCDLFGAYEADPSLMPEQHAQRHAELRAAVSFQKSPADLRSTVRPGSPQS